MLHTSIFLRIGLALVAAATGFATATAAPNTGGTDILHFFDHVTFTNNGVITNATGRLDARQNEQGHANNETLEISVRNLHTNTPYSLLVSAVDNTNLTSVTDFITDSRGQANLLFRKLGNGKAVGKGKLSLPAALDPVSTVRTVAIVNGNTQAVLTADLTAPDRLQYLIKRDLSTTSVAASLRIQATVAQTQFRLRASGLPATNDFLLVLNGGIVQTNATDARGRLDIRSLLAVPTDILDLRTVELWNTSSNVVVSTTLP
jgi:hypothetical protein